MKRLIILALTTVGLVLQTAAQQNWAAVPCSKTRKIDVVSKMFIDSLHNEIILNSINGSTVCNTVYKGLYAYNGSGFHDLDKGVNLHDPNAAANSLLVSGCIPFGNKTLFGGGFYSVGSNTLFTKSIATWNGAVWDTFPIRCFNNTPNNSSGGGFYGFLRWNGKLWMYGKIDTIGNTITKNLVAYDGNTFTPVPAIPVTNNSPITNAIVYKNKLIVIGNFDNYPSNVMWRVAQFDGSNWAPVGSGILGGIGSVWDMAVYNDTLYLAGAYAASAGNAGNYIMKWDGTQLSDAGFGGFCGYGAILNLIPFKNRLYAFGNFMCAANQKAFGVAYYENGSWTVPQDSVDNWKITSAVLYNNSIYIAGGFKSINGDTTIQKFAKLICPDFDAAAGCVSSLKKPPSTLNFKIFPNPSSGKVKFQFEEDIAIKKIEILSVLGQKVYDLNNPIANPEIDVSHLPMGLYFIKVENEQKSGIFKFVKE